MADKIKYVFILSERYSGSTLLSFLLASHPGISTIGERRKFYNNSLKSDSKALTCSCGLPFDKCEHWTEIRSTFLGKTEEQNLNLSKNFTEIHLFENRWFRKLASKLFLEVASRKLLFLFPFKKRLKQALRLNHALISSILEVDGKKVFLDSSKTMGQLLFLSQIESLEIRVIWLTRDPRAQVSSHLKYNNHSIHKATNFWIKSMRLNERVLRNLKISHTKLRYEDLCSNPELALQNLFDFLEMPSNYSLEFREKKQHIMGNYSMRLGTDNKIEERNDWKSRLNKSDIELIEKMTDEYSDLYSFQ